MMLVKDIYTKYRVPPNLQEHMMRVGGIAKIIADNWTDNSLDDKTVVSACLTHDLGNLLKFDLVNKINFLGEEAKNVEYWRKVKAEMAEKYGSDEHLATAAICREINLDSKAFWIVENWGFGSFDKVLASKSFEYKICVYSDHRIGPFGIVSLQDRFAEQRKRYEQQKHDSGDVSAHLSDQGRLANCAYEVEKQIQGRVKIDLGTISDDQVKKTFERFSGWDI